MVGFANHQTQSTKPQKSRAIHCLFMVSRLQQGADIIDFADGIETPILGGC
jgi:hypothetical protein